MTTSYLGTSLIILGAVLGLLAVLWLAVNAAAGILAPGGLVLGLFFLVLFVLPLIAAGLYVRRRAVEELSAAASFEERRRLLEQDRLFRQTLHRQARLAAERLEARASAAQGEAADLLKQAQLLLAGLSEDAAQPVSEVDWLHATALTSRDARDVERYDDLLLAAVRRIREGAEQAAAVERTEAARSLLELARSAHQQFMLRQDLVLRGRRLPPIGPLQLLRAEIPTRSEIAPESLRPGDAVSRGSRNYLVTAHVTYFARGRVWHTLVLRGEEGEWRLLVEPGADRALLLKPAADGGPPGAEVETGSASVSIDSLTGSAEGVVVDYRRTRGEGHLEGWWERWPEGERAFLGEQIDLSELRFWPSAVGTASRPVHGGAG